jgi:hypothetical protein
MEKYGQVVFKPQLLVHGSLDGHLLVSSIDGWYVTNPVTRHWVAVPNLSPFDVVGFYYYEHVPCGEYRVLCFCPKESLAVYGVLKVTTVQLRVIGRPISAAAPADHGLALGVAIHPVQLQSPPALAAAEAPGIPHAGVRHKERGVQLEEASSRERRRLEAA